VHRGQRMAGGVCSWKAAGRKKVRRNRKLLLRVFDWQHFQR
jgi:hypothetical protein